MSCGPQGKMDAGLNFLFIKQDAGNKLLWRFKSTAVFTPLFLDDTVLMQYPSPTARPFHPLERLYLRVQNEIKRIHEMATRLCFCEGPTRYYWSARFLIKGVMMAYKGYQVL